MARHTLSVLLLAFLTGCGANSSNDDFKPGAGGSVDSGTGGAYASGGAGGSSYIDPDAGDGRLDPDSSCGYATIPTQREPGSILLVVDRSWSMSRDLNDEEPAPGEAKWDMLMEAMNAVIPNLPGDAQLGLLLYPKGGGEGCSVQDSPQVAIGPLSSNATPLLEAFDLDPDGDTPTDKALTIAYAHLSALPGSGKRGVMLMTDGEWNCGANGADIFSLVEQTYQNDGMMTFAVGLEGASTGSLSHLAHVGGADRIPNCNSDLYVFDPAKPLQDNSCGSDKSTCCHFVVGTGDFESDLIAAIEDIATRFLSSCVFEVPKGTDPTQFDEKLVNVYVDGELVQQDGTEGWTYSGGGTDSLEVHGDLCDQLLAGEKDQVEIELGCPTYIK